MGYDPATGYRAVAGSDFGRYCESWCAPGHYGGNFLPDVPAPVVRVHKAYADYGHGLLPSEFRGAREPGSSPSASFHASSVTSRSNCLLVSQTWSRGRGFISAHSRFSVPALLVQSTSVPTRLMVFSATSRRVPGWGRVDLPERVCGIAQRSGSGWSGCRSPPTSGVTTSPGAFQERMSPVSIRRARGVLSPRRSRAPRGHPYWLSGRELSSGVHPNSIANSPSAQRRRPDTNVRAISL